MKTSVSRAWSLKPRHFAGLILSALLLSPLANANPGGPDPRKIHRYEAKAPHADVPAGGARANVTAPVGVVRGVVTDFKNYASIITRFDKAQIVGRNGDKTDVYLQAYIMKRTAKIWGVVRVEPPKIKDGEEIIEGRMLQGNVKRLDATWRIKHIDEKSSELKLELSIVPKLPLPDSLVVSEERYAAFKGVEGIRKEAEKRHGQGTK